MSFDLEKSSKFLLLFVNFFFHGLEHTAAKGTMVDIDGQFSNELQIHNEKTMHDCSNPKTVKEIPER